MRESLGKIKLTTFIVIGVQLIAAITFGILYLNNAFNLQTSSNTIVIYSVLVGLLLIDAIWFVFILFYFSIYRKRTDLTAAELIGEDIVEAYNFGMLGLVVVNEENTVLWINDLFKDRQIDILDMDILEWQPALKELIESGSNAVVRISLNSRTYEVKYLKEAGLYIFKDVTDLETITEFSRKQSTVVGQIVIDNYSEITKTGDDSSDLMTEVRSIILDYCKEHGVLVRKTSNDSYFILCNYESLELMEKDKFHLLDEIREIGQKQINPPTISIGIAYDFPDVIKLSEMASNAIEIAMGRGGDQAIVSQYGEELVFFGGKSSSQESRNKVKIRVLADSVISLIKNSSNIVIMGHVTMDMDALGACLGIKAICDHCGKDAVIVYDPKKTERKTKSAIVQSFAKEDAYFFVNEQKALNEIRSNTLVVVLDVHKPSLTMAPKIIEKASKIMVIDHHRRSDEFIESPIFTNIDPSASSTSEIIAELVYYATENPRIIIPENYATIMLSGIFLDSNYFKNTSSGSKTFEASMILKEFGADNGIADDFLKDEYEEYALVNKIVGTMKTPYYGVVYCVCDDEDIIEQSSLAKVANQCMQMKGVNAAFVVGRTAANEVKISCRSDGTVNVQIIAEKLNGGGHFTQAAGIFQNETVSQAETKLLNVLSDTLGDARINKEER